MVRAIHELVAALRRAGIRVSSAESLDAVRAALAVGVQNKADLQGALCATLAKTQPERERIAPLVARFFSEQGAAGQDLYARLEQQGFSADEIQTLRTIVEATARTSPAASVLHALSQGELAMEQLLGVNARRFALEDVGDPARAGFLTMRVLEAARVPRAETDLAGIRVALRGALGERGKALAAVLEAELVELRARARAHVTERIQKPERAAFESLSFDALSAQEMVRMECAVRELAQRLLGKAAVRSRRARRGRIDARRTMRKALRTGGIPIAPHFRKRRLARPKLVMLCDVSESMRNTARFMLTFVHAAQRLFADARSFVFVSNVADATRVFQSEPPEKAVELAYRGGIVSVADNSNYANTFRALLARHSAAFDQRTTLLVLGDGRTNHLDPGTEALHALTSRVRRVLWLTPEPRGAWSSADSALSAYAPDIDELLPVNDLTSLQAAARALMR